MIGRHDSCYNVHARRPKFFCLVEVKIGEIDSQPDEIGRTSSCWCDLSWPSTCETGKPPLPVPHLPHAYGPRQAEYVANLMRFDVESGQCGEAFYPGLWDETLENLQFLDLIEKSFHQEADHLGTSWQNVVRQIEGSTLWTMLGIEDDNPHIGCIEWTGTVPCQGLLPSMSQEDAQAFIESMAGDCTQAQAILQQTELYDGFLEVFSYGSFEQYRGVRSIKLPLQNLQGWWQKVEEQWKDYDVGRPFTFHVVQSQPSEPQPGLHIIVRSVANPTNSHFILVDQIDESPLNRNGRMVVALSQQPNGYELLLATHNDINTISSRTIIKTDATIWPLYRILHVQDGQYWRILHDYDDDGMTLFQQQVEIHHSYSETHSRAEHSLLPHVFDRWCDGGNVLHDDEGDDDTSFMQRHLQDVPHDDDGSDIEISDFAWNNFCEICLLSPVDFEEPWTLMSHGLLQEHYDSRPLQVSTLTLQSVRAALRAVWEDVQHRARIHAVKPNPEDGPYAHIIIEFETMGQWDPLAIPILRRIYRNGHMQCEAAFHFETAHAYDLYDQAGLSSICSPWADHECRLFLNGIQLRETLPFRLRPGSLLDIHVTPLPPPLQDDTESLVMNPDVQVNDESDFNSLMQNLRPSRPRGTALFQFYHLENDNFQVVIEETETRDLETVVENERFLPTDGPLSIRTFHWVANVPIHINGGSNVYIMEQRGDSAFRLMSDDALCLYQLTIEQDGPDGDSSTRMRVLWTPGVASRERILFHIRVADICRTKTCQISVNGIPWHEHDSIIKHFRDGDFILLRVKVEQGDSVLATRCDIQSYEAVERQRRVFTNSSGSEGTPETMELLHLPVPAVDHEDGMTLTQARYVLKIRSPLQMAIHKKSLKKNIHFYSYVPIGLPSRWRTLCLHPQWLLATSPLFEKHETLSWAYLGSFVISNPWMPGGQH